MDLPRDLWKIVALYVDEAILAKVYLPESFWPIRAKYEGVIDAVENKNKSL